VDDKAYLTLDARQPASFPAARTAYEEKALAFCRAWVAGQDAFVLHTSGSTGTPKPITLTRRQMQASAQLTGRTFGLVAGDRALVCLGIDYIAGTMMLVRGLELGLRLTIVEPRSDPFLDLPPESAVFEFAAFVPLQIRTLINRGEGAIPILNRMKTILVGGAAVDPALEKALSAVNAPIYSTYGMTETVSHIAIRPLNGPEATDWLTVLDGVEVALDERSCLAIRSVATNGEWVQTNDIVELVDKRRFRLLGRADWVINSGGVKIQPERVEAVVADFLARQGISARLLVVGLPDPVLGQRLALVLEGVRPDALLLEQLRAHLRNELGPYAVPKQFELLPVFPVTATGKVNRRAVVQSLLNHS